MGLRFSKLLLFICLAGSFTTAHAVSYSVSSFKTDLQIGATGWASVLKMTLSQQGREEKFCSILSTLNGVNCCKGFLGFGTPEVCYSGHDPLEAFSRYGLKYQLVQAPPPRQPAVFAKVVESIRKNKMPAFRYQSADELDVYHIVAVFAVHNVESPENMVFEVVDPVLGKYKLSARQLKKEFATVENDFFYLVGAYIPY